MKLTPQEIDQAAIDAAQRDWERLVAAGWSYRDAARFSREKQHEERAWLTASQTKEEK